jgi:hypothetical protein
MDIVGKKLWQVAAGDSDRHYARLCLRWDVVLDGPGSAGPWPSREPVPRNEWGGVCAQGR